MESHDWRLEMENMLAAFNRQATHSLSIIKLAFKRSSLLFTPEFKKHFVQASTNRIIETYDRFQVNLMIEEQNGLNSVPIVPNRSPRNGSNAVICNRNDDKNGTSLASESDWITNASDSIIQIDDSDYEIVIGAIEAESTDDTTAVENGASSNANLIDDLHDANEPETNSDSNFTVEMGESNDSIDLVENQSDLTDAAENELNPVNVVFNNKTTIADVSKGNIKTTPSNRKKPNKNRTTTTTQTHMDSVSVTTKAEKSHPKQSLSKNRLRCTVCEYVGLHMGNLNRHMRTHTGDRPHQCDRCDRRFTNAQSLMKHAETHIVDFPFHCRACFHGFSLKAEAIAHEKRCQQRHFECYLCKMFLTCNKHELVRHMRIHTGDKPFRCEICMKHFGWKNDLKRHLNTVHTRINKR